LILQEAVMAGVPVLTSELAVFREQLADAGWYAPSGDVQAWGHLMAQAFAASAREVLEAQSRRWRRSKPGKTSVKLPNGCFHAASSACSSARIGKWSFSFARNIAREVLQVAPCEFRVQGRTQETHVGHIDQPHFVVGRHDNVAQVQ
jgi:hypothetical protein